MITLPDYPFMIFSDYTPEERDQIVAFIKANFPGCTHTYNFLPEAIDESNMGEEKE